MYSEWIGPAIAGFLAVWLGILSYLIWQQGQFLRSLFPKSGERDIRIKFGEVLDSVSDFEKSLSEIKKDLKQINIEGLDHIQKVELLRFNPYEDTGGDQSFTIALLNNNGNGIVLTSLHARSGTRIFAKTVVKGKGGNYKLSKEEELVINKALKND